MRDFYYKLGPDGKTPVVATAQEANEAIGTRVAFDDEHRISTVFLGINHAFGDGPPILFETLWYPDGPDGGHTIRYETWDEAMAGHKRRVEWAKGLNPEAPKPESGTVAFGTRPRRI